MTADYKNNKAVAVVTGSSSGIGYETSLLLARNWFFTCATNQFIDVIWMSHIFCHTTTSCYGTIKNLNNLPNSSN